MKTKRFNLTQKQYLKIFERAYDKAAALPPKKLALLEEKVLLDVMQYVYDKKREEKNGRQT